MMELDYEKDMQIDPDALDVEWLEQASISLKYGKHLCDLRAKAKQLAERVKVIRSELIRKANVDPEGCCHKAKPNAADIEAFYRCQEEYKEAMEARRKAEYELEYAEIAKNEICYTRKAALENLVILYGQQYFAGPKVPRDIGKEWESRQKQRKANAQIAHGLQRKRKLK